MPHRVVSRCALIRIRALTFDPLSRCSGTLKFEEPAVGIYSGAPMASGGSAPAVASGNAPQKIQRLDEAVVNKIAAGEVRSFLESLQFVCLSVLQVVQRPANAIKEMMENR